MDGAVVADGEECEKSSGSPVKAHIRDLCYNRSNLYSNHIIRDMLIKWTDHPPGICR